MSKLLFATQNSWKIQLFRPVFQLYGFELIGLSDTGLELQSVQEDGSTVAENALNKVRHYHSEMFPWVFADDMGIEIEALDGEPGVQARRWGGLFPDDVDEQAWLDYLLMRMDGIHPSRRGARFLDGWALMTPGGDTYTREIQVAFEIAERPIRPMQIGSPIAAVAIGFPDDPREILAQAQARFDAWGIFDKLKQSEN